jgi:hypothetical protein
MQEKAVAIKSQKNPIVFLPTQESRFASVARGRMSAPASQRGTNTATEKTTQENHLAAQLDSKRDQVIPALSRPLTAIPIQKNILNASRKTSNESKSLYYKLGIPTLLCFTGTFFQIIIARCITVSPLRIEISLAEKGSLWIPFGTVSSDVSVCHPSSYEPGLHSMSLLADSGFFMWATNKYNPAFIVISSRATLCLRGT